MSRNRAIFLPVLLGIGILFIAALGLRRSGRGPSRPPPGPLPGPTAAREENPVPAKAAGEVSIEVLDLGDRTPLSQVRLRVGTVRGAVAAQTDSAGFARISPAGSSIRSILAQKDGYLTEYRKLPEGCKDAVTVALHPLQSLCCRFMYSGVPVRVSGTVRIDCLACKLSTSDAHESAPPWEFALAESAPDNVTQTTLPLSPTLSTRVRISAILGERTLDPRVIELASGLRFTAVDLEVGSAARCRGRVEAEGSRPVSGASVHLEQDGFKRATFSDAAGFFEFEGARRAAAELSAWAPGFTPRSSQFDLKDETLCTLVLEPSDEVLVKGRVIDEFGRPVSGATVEATAGRALTDAAGGFELRVPGSISRSGILGSVIASKAGYAEAGLYALRFPIQDLTLVMYRGAQFIVTLKAAPPNPWSVKLRLVRAYVTADPRALDKFTRGCTLQLSQPGDYPQEGLLPGLYQLTAQSEGLGERTYFADVHEGKADPVPLD